MLVLSRRPGQRLIIAGDIEITVLEVRGDLVKLGIHAPKSIPVYREEVYQEILEANRQAAGPATPSLPVVGSPSAVDAPVAVRPADLGRLFPKSGA